MGGYPGPPPLARGGGGYPWVPPPSSTHRAERRKKFLTLFCSIFFIFLLTFFRRGAPKIFLMVGGYPPPARGPPSCPRGWGYPRVPPPSSTNRYTLTANPDARLCPVMPRSQKNMCPAVHSCARNPTHGAENAVPGCAQLCLVVPGMGACPASKLEWRGEV